MREGVELADWDRGQVGGLALAICELLDISPTRLDRRTAVFGTFATLLTFASSGARAAAPWPEGRAGAVSLTYDDALDSQLDHAAPALEARGLRGTFFVTLDASARRASEWLALAERGHELADHTVHHPCDLARRHSEEFGRSEIEPVERWLRAVGPNRLVRSFAYPCDVTNLGPGSPNRQEKRYDALLRKLGIEAARTSEGEPNRPATAVRRPHKLQALAVGYDAQDLPTVRSYLTRAANAGHWAILVFHGVGAADAGMGSIPEDMHDGILDAVADGPLWCSPMSDVFERIRSGA